MAVPSVQRHARSGSDTAHRLARTPADVRDALQDYYRRKQSVQQGDATVTVLRFGLFLLALAFYLLI